MGTKLVIISLDAMIAEDLPILAKHRVFQEFFEESAQVKAVRSIYPTLTYPCHATMISGLLPDRHGVTANSPLCPGVKPIPWNFYHDAQRGRDLFDACKEAGLTTAAVAWPVTGNHPSIDYLVDEIWPTKEQMSPRSLKDVILGSGTSEEIFEEIVKPLVPIRLPRTQPQTAIFNTRIAAGILRKYRPDVLALHLAEFDHYRHKMGVHGPLIEKGARWADTPAEVAAASEVVITIVGYPKDVEDVYLGPKGILETKKGGYVVDMTTSSPILAKRRRH
ncbi:MAG: alkaline phosphatase family protein [Lachnospiraceae bacterium]|nr:alkaline phosphatase family protein [Lachnospiraceae bacterium]